MLDRVEFVEMTWFRASVSSLGICCSFALTEPDIFSIPFEER